MDDQEYEALASRHGRIRALTRTVNGNKERVAVFRGITFAELEPLFGTEENPVRSQRSMASTCLLWPDKKDWKQLVKDYSTVVSKAAMVIRAISGEQCVFSVDEKEKTTSAYLPAPEDLEIDSGDDEDDVAERGTKLFTVGKLAFVDYERYVAARKSGSLLAAQRLACVNAGTFPVKREDRIAVFNDLPYLADLLVPFVLMHSGGDLDIEGN